MISSNEVETRIQQYLRGDVDLESLRDWLVEAQLDEANVDPSARELLSEIEGRYAEVSDGLIAQSSFKKYLFEAVVRSDTPNRRLKSEPIIVVYSSGGNVKSIGQGPSNAPQVARMCPISPQTMLPVVVRLVGER